MAEIESGSGSRRLPRPLPFILAAMLGFGCAPLLNSHPLAGLHCDAEDLAFNTESDYLRAQSLWLEIEEDSPDSDDHILSYAELLIENNYLDQAAVLSRRVIESDASSVRGHQLLALTYERRSEPNLEAAASALWTARALDPADPGTRLRLGLVQLGLAQTRSAEEELKAAARLAADDRTRLSANLGLYSLYCDEGDSARASAALDVCKSIEPDVGAMLMELSRIENLPASVLAGKDVSDGVHEALETRAERLMDLIREENHEP